MKVSLNIKVKQLENGYTGHAILRHKLHQKMIDTEIQHPEVKLAVENVLDVALSSLKTSCNVDVFFESKGDKETSLKVVELIKKKILDSHHILRLYHS